MNNTRFCPRCHTEMSFRLGEFSCPGCQHSEAVNPVKQEVELAKPHESVKRARLLEAPGAAPEAPRGSLGGIVPNEMYTGPELQEVGDKLKLEKVIFISAIVVWNAIISFMMMGGGSFMDGVLGMSHLGISPTFYVFIVLFSLGMLGLALFSETIFLKWACLGLYAFSGFFTLLGLIAIFAGVSPVPATTFMKLTYAVGFVFALWLVNLLYKDIQRING